MYSNVICVLVYDEIPAQLFIPITELKMLKKWLEHHKMDFEMTHKLWPNGL